MDQEKAYFISDLHLGAQWIADNRAHELAIAEMDQIACRQSLRALILGDAIDYWYEYRTVVPRGFVRFFAALHRSPTPGRRSTGLKATMTLWIFDYLPREIGVKVIDGPLHTRILGHTFYLEHGDLSGEPRPSYRRMQRTFRNPTAQRLATAKPRWTVGFAHRWSSHHGATAKRHPTGSSDNDQLITSSQKLPRHASRHRILRFRPPPRGSRH